MLLDLSTELLQEIGSQVNSTRPNRRVVPTLSQLCLTDHGSLRRVCKHLDGPMQPFVFSDLVLQTSKLCSKDGLDRLEALATGWTGWSRHAETLRLTPGDAWIITPDGDAVKMQNLLASALRSMAKIRVVIWKVRADGPSWVLNAMCEFMSTNLTVLNELQLEIQGDHRGVFDLPLPRLSGLRKLTIKDDSHWWFTNSALPMAQKISHIIARNHLTSLHAEFPAAGVWSMLRTKIGSQPDLIEITTWLVTPDFLAYLGLCGGLKKLTLQNPDGDSLADTFFRTVLPNLTASLVELSCGAAYEGRWSFGTHNAHIISQMKKLTALEMSINAGRVEQVDIRPGFAAIGQYLVRWEVKVEQSDIDVVVTNFLHTAATLPALLSLAIVAANTNNNRGASTGTMTSHIPFVTRAIETAVQNFRPTSAAPPTVRTGSRTYELKAVQLAEGGAEASGGSFAYGARIPGSSNLA
ncbi:hypothetical protein DFH09DRAFT_627075 [Mycena vulgaris]|nr:hypothetical protein DFH09DRAFT_627075 [Mycena vulgaris]